MCISPTISGTTSVCVDATTTLTGSGTAATTSPWASSDDDVATVSNLGLVTGVAAGTVTITYTDNNGCSTTETVTVNALPAAPTTSNIAYCQDETATALSATALTGHTLVWYDTDATTVLASAPTPTTTTAGNTTYYAAQSNDNTGCEGAQASITVTVNPTPTISGTTSVCVDATTTLTGSGTAATTSPWASSDDDVATVSNLGLVTGVAAGTVTITYTDNNGCSTTETVTVNALPAAPTTSNIAYCQDETATALSATALTGHTLVWYDTDATTVLASAPTPTTTTAGNTTYYAAQSNDNTGCEGAQASITVTVNPTPTISGTTSVCVDATTTLTGSGTAATTSPWASSDDDVATVSNLGLVTGVAAGTVTITYTDNNGCSTTETVTVNALPAAPTTSNIAYCQDETATALSATALTGHTLVWYDTDATTVLASAPTPTTTTAGNTTYYAAQSNDNTGCEGAQASITVTVNPTPTISGTTSVCVDATTTLTGSGTAATTSPWASSDDDVATVSNLGLVTGVAAGTVTITYTDNNGCSTTETVTVNALPAAPTTSNIAYCQDETATALSATALTGHTLVWYDTDATTVLASAPTPTTTTAGNTTYYAAQSNDNTGCEGAQASITVTVNPTPTISGTTSVCVDATTTLTGSGTAATTSPWASSDDDVATVSNLGLVTGVAAGTVTITYTDNNGCSTTETVTVNALPAAPTTSNIAYCQDETATALSATALTGHTLVWYDTDATTVLASAPTPTTTTAGNTTYYAAQSNDNTGCEGAQASITVTVNPTPTISGTTSVCVDATTTLTGSGTAATTSPWASSDDDVATVSNLGLVTGVAAGTVTITYTDNNGCSTTETVTVNALPAAPTTSNIAYCQDETATALSATALTGHTLVWYDTDATTVLASAPTPTTTTAGNTTYYAAQSNDNTGCEGAQASITVTVNPTPTISGTTSVCVDATTTLTGSGTAATTSPWASSDDDVATVSNLGLVTGVAAGTVTITYTDNNGCSTTETVTVNALPAAPTTSNIAYCQDETATALSATALTGHTLVWYDTDATTVLASAPTPTTTTAGNTTYYAAQSNDNTGCEGAQASITVTVNPTPTISGTTSVCVDATTTLTGSGTAATTSPWASSDDDVATVSNLGLVTGVAAGTVTITYTDNNGCSTTETVTVNALPAAPTTSNIAYCQDETATALSATALTGHTLVWYDTDATTVLASAPTPTTTTAGNTTYYAAQSNDNTGCEGAQASITVTVNPTPTISGTTSVCVDATTTLTGSGTAATTSPWASSDDDVATVSNLGLVTGVAAGTVTITYTDNNGCSTTETVTVNALPAAPTTSNIAYCQDETATALSATALTGHTLVWYDTDATTVLASAPTPTTTTAGNTTYYAAQSNDNTGCEGAQASITVTVNPTPTISGTTSVCVDATTTLTGSGTAATTSPWASSDDDVATVSNLGLVTGVAAGTVTITYTDNNGCSTTETVTVNALPAAPTTSNIAYCQDETATALSATALTGHTLVWYDTDATTVLASAPTPTTTTAGNTTYYAAQSNDNTGCEGAQASITVTVNPTPTISGTTSVCVDATTTLTGSGTAATTSPWASSDDDVATVSNLGLVTGVAAGTVTITYTDNNGCSTTETVTVNALPAAPTTSNIAYCQDETATALSATALTGHTLVWYDTDATTVLASAPTPTTTTAGNTTYYAAQSNDNTGCEGAQASITVTVNPTPTISGTTSVCVDATTTLTGSGTAATTSPWASSDDDVATVSNLGLVTGVAAGTVTITYTDNNGCSTTETVTVNALPAAPTTSNIAYCQDETATALSATALTGHTLVWYDTDATTVLASAPTPTTTTAGNTTYYAAQSNDNTGCEGAQASITVTVNPTPTISGTTSVCVDATTTLTGSGTAATTSPWASSDDDVATVSNLGLVTGVAAGTVTITYTDNNGCSTTETVTVNALPAAPTTSNIAYCQDETATALSATALTGHTLVWYDTDATTVLASAPTPTTTTAGNTTYYAAQSNDNTGCEGAQASITVTVNPTPTISGTTSVCVDATTTLTGSGTAATTSPWASSDDDVATVSNLGLVTGVAAGTVTITYTDNNGCSTTETVTVNALPAAPTTSNIAYCQDETATALSATALTGHTLVWYDTDATTVLASAPTPTTTTAGNTTYYAAQSNDNTGCEGAQASITVTVNPTPTISGTTSVCVDATTTLTGSGTAATTSPWASSDDDVATVSNLGLVTGVAAGTVTITYTDNNGCSTTETVTVNALPAAPTTSNIAYCQDETATALSATALTGHTLVWYDTDATTVLASAPTPTTTTAGNTTYYAAQSNDNTGCEGAQASITVTVNPTPTISGTTSVCVDATTTLTGSGTAATTSPWASSDDDVATVSNLGLVTGVAAGTVTITYTDNNGCSTTETVTVNALPAAPTTSNIAYCQDETATALSATALTGHTLVWYDTDATTVLASAPTPTTTTAGNTTYYAAQSNDNTGCEGAQASITVTVNPTPTISGTTSVCVDATTTLTGSGTAATTSPWASSDDDVATVSNLGLVTGVAAGTVTITYTDNNGCSTTETVTVNALPAAPTTSNIAYCQDETATALSATALTGHTLVWYDTDATTVLASAPTPTTTTAGNTTYYAAQSNDNTGCEGAQASITVTVNPTPTISGTTSVCVDATTTLTGSGTAATTSPWASSDDDVATVSNLGLVTGVAAGTVTITYTDNNGCSTTETVTVNQHRPNHYCPCCSECQCRCRYMCYSCFERYAWYTYDCRQL